MFYGYKFRIPDQSIKKEGSTNSFIHHSHSCKKRVLQTQIFRLVKDIRQSDHFNNKISSVRFSLVFYIFGRDNMSRFFNSVPRSFGSKFS